MSSSISYFRLR